MKTIFSYLRHYYNYLMDLLFKRLWKSIPMILLFAFLFTFADFSVFAKINNYNTDFEEIHNYKTEEIELSEVDNMTNQEIDYYLESLDVKIIDSEIVTGRDLVSDKYDRIKALTAIKSKYNGTNSIYYMSAEWQGHNIVYPLTNNPANIDINSKDPRFTVRAGAYLLIALGVI